MTDIITRARTWIATGYGLGTFTLWAHMMGVRDFYIDHPQDKSDLTRVIELIRNIPEWESRIPELAALSPVWGQIASRWEALVREPKEILKIVQQPKGTEDRMLARITAMMARSSQPSPDWKALKARYAAMSLDERVNTWIVSGDIGQSSKTIWAVMLDISLEENEINHPRDPADLGRCLRLLELMPEWNPRVGELADLSPAWDALVGRWTEIRSSMEAEAGIAWEKAKSAPQTYDLMRAIIDEARNTSL